jgi:ABC-type transport system substrate-binding protein
MVADRTKRLQRYRRGDFDAVHFNDLGNLDYSNSERLNEVNTFPFNATMNVHFKFNNKHLRRRGVRQAMAYILDLNVAKRILESNGIPATPTEHQVDLPVKTKEAWFDQEFLSQVIDYGVESRTEKARQAMRDAGYTKEGSVWVGPDGDPIQGIDYLVPDTFKKMQIVGQFVDSQLNEFGIKTELRFSSYNTFQSEFRESGGGPDMAGHWGGSGPGVGYPMYAWVRGNPGSVYAHSAPTSWFGAVARDYNVPTPDTCQRVEFEAPPLQSDRDPVYNHPVRPSYPAEVGANEIGDDGQTLYPMKWKWESDQAQDREVIVDRSKKMAWYLNWNLPRINIYSEIIEIAGNTKDFEWETTGALAGSQRPTIQMALGGADPR